MPELSHDAAEDGFHEIQLSGKQIVFLFMTTTVVLVVVFLCGVLVGRNTRVSDEAIDSALAAPGPAPATTAEAGPAAAEPPAPPAEDELSYHQRLQGKGTSEQLKPKPAETRGAPAAAPTPAPAPAPDVPTAGKPGTWFVQVIALQNRADAAAMVKKLLARGLPAYLELPGRGAPAIYRVRVGRYSDRREAEQVARRLKEDKFTAEVRR